MARNIPNQLKPKITGNISLMWSGQTSSIDKYVHKNIVTLICTNPKINYLFTSLTQNISKKIRH